MTATKGNKVYTITEQEMQFYVDSGFDILDDTGKVIKHGRGKTVPYDEYLALKEELEALKAAKGGGKKAGE